MDVWDDDRSAGRADRIDWEPSRASTGHRFQKNKPWEDDRDRETSPIHPHSYDDDDEDDEPGTILKDTSEARSRLFAAGPTPAAARRTVTAAAANTLCSPC
ncbi:hypothetical protein KIN20_014329 [Parelaphostrongylus tenuis]|uniref:Uncharacterized protein n=1 Tax=Parelaphostrongylus tenuis TaxID=148309 RepID=A0AAD5MDG4_PARTN|nr:hypothetical protein KIN20_014329 [Parelaphostrongylus tenuis]